MHDSGLVHVSRMADRFIRDPHEVVAVGDIVHVWVMEVDKERRRVSLTMVRPGSERPRRPARGEGGAGDQAPHDGRDRRAGRRDRPPTRSGPGGCPAPAGQDRRGGRPQGQQGGQEGRPQGEHVPSGRPQGGDRSQGDRPQGGRAGQGRRPQHSGARRAPVSRAGTEDRPGTADRPTATVAATAALPRADRDHTAAAAKAVPASSGPSPAPSSPSATT